MKQVRNKNEAIADLKATLCKRLNELCRRVPLSIMGAGVMATRKWVAEQKDARKVLESERSSVQALNSAINRMEAAGRVDSDA